MWASSPEIYLIFKVCSFFVFLHVIYVCLLIYILDSYFISDFQIRLQVL